MGVAGVLLRSLEPERLPGPIYNLSPVVAAGAVFCFYLSIFLPLHQMELLRSQVLEEAIAAGASEVAVPAYDHGGYLWDADSAYKMELVYYRESPGDLAISFVPMDQWEG